MNSDCIYSYKLQFDVDFPLLLCTIYCVSRKATTNSRE